MILRKIWDTMADWVKNVHNKLTSSDRTSVMLEGYGKNDIYCA